MFEYAHDILEMERLRLFKVITRFEETSSTYENHISEQQRDLIDRRFDDITKAISILKNYKEE